MRARLQGEADHATLPREIEFVASGEEGRDDWEDTLQHGENGWGGA